MIEQWIRINKHMEKSCHFTQLQRIIFIFFFCMLISGLFAVDFVCMWYVYFLCDSIDCRVLFFMSLNNFLRHLNGFFWKHPVITEKCYSKMYVIEKSQKIITGFRFVCEFCWFCMFVMYLFSVWFYNCWVLFFISEDI